MPYINDKEYLTLPQQVKKNKDDILDNKTELDADVTALEAKDIEQDGRLDDHDIDIEQLQDAGAAGGVMVTRKAGLRADLDLNLVETKITFDVETQASNDTGAITKDANNDTVLITEGQYNIEFPVSVQNDSGGSRTATVNIYIKDAVTLAETLLKSIVITLPTGETVNTKPQVDYTRPAGNNQIVIVKMLESSADVVLKDNSEVHVTSYFTTAGSGTATQTKNISLTDQSLEAMSSDNSESLVKDNFETLKKMIQKDGFNTQILRNGLLAILLTDTTMSLQGARRLVSVLDPTDAQDAVTKNHLELYIKPNGTNTEIYQNGLLRATFRSDGMSINGQVRNMSDPTAAQDAVTKNFMNKYIDDDGSGATILVREADGVQMIKLRTDGAIDMNNRSVRNVNTPNADGDAVDWNTSTLTAGTSITLTEGKIRKLADIVHVTIRLTPTANRSSGDTLFTIPANYRLSGTQTMNIYNTGTGTEVPVRFNTDGTVETRGSLTSGFAYELTTSYIL